MFKLQSSSKYSPFDAIHLSRHFSTIQNSFWTCRFWSFSASAIFCFTSSTSAKYFPLRTFFTQGNKKKVTQGKIRWIGRVGHRGHAAFWSLTTEASVQCGQVLVNHPSRNGQTNGVFRKNSLKPNAASHNNATWYTHTDGLLEHSPSKGSLQKVISVWGASPSYIIK